MAEESNRIMKKTGMAKSDAKKLMGQMAPAGGAAFGKVAEVVDRKEQRKLDQAAGLVPFAVKLHGDVVAQLHALAKERGTDMNETVAAVLAKGLA
jgi:cytosine/adenosine deaminase-related metal-dependent hydrolase